MEENFNKILNRIVLFSKIKAIQKINILSVLGNVIHNNSNKKKISHYESIILTR